MKILFLGDVVGISGCSKLMNNLMNEIKSKNIDFVIVNGENAASQGVGLTREICHDFFNCGVDVITTGNHVWDQKEIMEYIDKEDRLLRPKNLFEPAPGRGFNIYNTKNDIKIGVLNLMGNVFMKKCDDVFEVSEKFMKQFNLKKDYDLLVVDFHGEITSEKNAIGHYFDGKASLVVGTHTHIPTNDARILTGGTGYQTDAGMCGDYNSVIGMNAENSLNRFLKKNSVKHFPAIGDATWLVLAGLFIGKPFGIFIFGWVAAKPLKFGLPEGMTYADIFVLGSVAAIGFTVSLFVASVAFSPGDVQDAAKMGALLSFFAAVMSIILGYVFKIKKVQ